MEIASRKWWTTSTLESGEFKDLVETLTSVPIDQKGIEEMINLYDAEIYQTDYYHFSDHSNGLEPAYLSTFLAEGAFFFINFRDRCKNRFFLFNDRVEKKVSIGLFHVTVQQLYTRTDGNSQVGGHSGFSGTAFSACNTDNHTMTIPLGYELMPVTYDTMFSCQARNANFK